MIVRFRIKKIINKKWSDKKARASQLLLCVFLDFDREE